MYNLLLSIDENKLAPSCANVNERFRRIQRMLKNSEKYKDFLIEVIVNY